MIYTAEAYLEKIQPKKKKLDQSVKVTQPNSTN